MGGEEDGFEDRTTRPKGGDRAVCVARSFAWIVPFACLLVDPIRSFHIAIPRLHFNLFSSLYTIRQDPKNISSFYDFLIDGWRYTALVADDGR